MENNLIDRRQFLKESLVVAGPIALGMGAPPLAAAAEKTGRTLKIVCIGAHPDDPESGCGGTLARYAALGHSVTVIYLTRGERGIRDKGLDEAAKIRAGEAETACKIMGTEPAFFGQIDGDTRVSREEVEKMSKLVTAQKPDIVLTHWPIDTHMDHQVASVLAIRAFVGMGEKPQIYYFEVNTGSQSQGFLPNTYVDISGSLEKKKAALFAHKSQGGEEIWREHHQIMAAWRGREIGVTAAEGFVRLNHGSGSDLEGH